MFQLDGQFSHFIVSDHLQYPGQIAVSSNDQLLVANNGHHCISIFTLDGNYMWASLAHKALEGRCPIVKQLLLLLICMASFL